ncbi:MAG: hypothetical protein AAF555_05820 [Verrucomicrobiota bacterium]
MQIKRTTLNLPDEVRRKLEEGAARECRSLSGQVEWLIRQSEAREQSNAEVVDA